MCFRLVLAVVSTVVVECWHQCQRWKLHITGVSNWFDIEDGDE